jgi:hypothetical protein
VSSFSGSEELQIFLIITDPNYFLLDLQSANISTSDKHKNLIIGKEGTTFHKDEKKQ